MRYQNKIQVNQRVKFHSLNDITVEFIGVVTKTFTNEYCEVMVAGEKSPRFVRTMRLQVVRDSFAGSCA